MTDETGKNTEPNGNPPEEAGDALPEISIEELPEKLRLAANRMG